MSDTVPAERRFYEGNGGWNDGRLGQAYDLVHAVLADRGDKRWGHPVLSKIEALDEEQPA